MGYNKLVWRTRPSDLEDSPDESIAEPYNAVHQGHYAIHVTDEYPRGEKYLAFDIWRLADWVTVAEGRITSRNIRELEAFARLSWRLIAEMELSCKKLYWRKP